MLMIMINDTDNEHPPFSAPLRLSWKSKALSWQLPCPQSALARHIDMYAYIHIFR